MASKRVSQMVMAWTHGNSLSSRRAMRMTHEPARAVTRRGAESLSSHHARLILRDTLPASFCHRIAFDRSVLIRIPDINR